ncbi:MAG: GNAT family N-acetyltransferase [Clostridia bacterium]|nr:GNAT family N-acetyltransferase [Clostridia bacterium]
MEVSLRKFEEIDIPKKVRWINDPNVNRYLHYDLPLEEEKTKVWFKKNKESTTRFDAVINVDNISVGLIGLLSIDSKNKKAEYYVCIGEQAYLGKGIAKKASIKLLDYAFNTLLLNKVYLYTEDVNVNAQCLFEKIGFKREGLLMDDLIYNGRHVNRFAMGILRKDFIKE